MALVRGGTVLPHVQRFADAVSKATGADSFGTYPGHDPSIERALDIFVPTTSRTLGDAIAAFAIANLDRFGIWYLIYRQRIYNPKIASYWRGMEDRGSPTQNHMDHVHVSFEATAPEEPDQYEAPTPEPEEAEGMKLIAVTEDRGIFLAGENVGEDGLIPARHVGTPEEITALVDAGAVSGYDKRPALPATVFDAYYRVVG